MSELPGKHKLRIDIGTDFSCAFLLTYGDECERLHGHNFQVALEIEGTLGSDNFLVDFRDVKQILRSICKKLDEHTLIATRNPLLLVSETQTSYSVRFKDKEYIFPRDDVLLLDLPNLSAEILAAYLCEQFQEQILEMGFANLSRITLELREKPGQSAFYSLRISKQDD